MISSLHVSMPSGSPRPRPRLSRVAKKARSEARSQFLNETVIESSIPPIEPPSLLPLGFDSDAELDAMIAAKVELSLILDGTKNRTYIAQKDVQHFLFGLGIPPICHVIYPVQLDLDHWIALIEYAEETYYADF